MLGLFFMLNRRREPVGIMVNEQGDINFLVFLRENDFYDTAYLPKGMQYIASLINHIDVTFNYVLSADYYMDYIYWYYIEADIIVFERNNPSNIIFRRTNNILESETYELSNRQSIVINHQLGVDYSRYNDLVRNFKSYYNITADSHVIFTIHTHIEASSEKIEETITTNNSMSLTIPLSEQMININMGYNEINNQEIFRGTYNDEAENYIYLGVLIFTSILLLIAIIKFLKFLRLSKTKNSVYQKTLKNILIEYDRVIVETKRIIDIPEDAHLIEVANFTEILDVSDKIGQPILFMEIHINQKCWFIVKSRNDFYRFILKDSDLE